MKQADFNQLAAAVDTLSPRQLLERLQHPETIPTIIEQLEQQLLADLKCPKCSHDQGIATLSLLRLSQDLHGFDRYTAGPSEKT